MCANQTAYFIDRWGGDEAIISEVSIILHQQNPPPRIIALLPPKGDPFSAPFVALPLHGSCLKAEIDETLPHILRAVAGGATFHSHGAIARREMVDMERTLAGKGATLSDSERRVLALLVRGLDNSSIAAQLHMAKSTVANCVHSIYAKLDIHSRVDLVLWFYGVTLPKAEK